MDEKKKQMLMFVILGVAILGAGSFYFLGDSGGGNRNVTQRAPRARKERVVADKTETNRRKKRETVDRGNRPKVERRERDESTASSKRRKIRRGDTKKIKKKKWSPAA